MASSAIPGPDPDDDEGQSTLRNMIRKVSSDVLIPILAEELSDAQMTKLNQARKDREVKPTAGTKLDDLSDPVILHILKNLTAVDLCAVAGTSSKMRRIAKDQTLWSNVIIELPTAAIGSDRGQSTISRIVDGCLGDFT